MLKSINPFRLVRKLVTAVVLMAIGAVVLGAYGVPVRNLADGVVDRVTFSFDRAVFHPDTGTDPVREIDLIRHLDDSLAPKLDRAKALIRKQRAEIDYLHELSAFLAQRMSAVELATVRDLATASEAIGTADADLDERQRSWIQYQQRIDALESSLERLVHLNERVATLYDQLRGRRCQTLALVPEEEVATRPPTEIEEAEIILTEVHEKLFKTLHAIDPDLLDQQRYLSASRD